ncbi:hypothetical protein ACFSR7_12545 [Cohnella sp. GCM10020058]|uniref:hypothetical protein n=1 Tax=Cohnella sp. GCM10020058 TaxID=3317330 RepID=UPI00363B8AEC
MSQEYKSGRWDQHGDYWIMQDKQGRAVALFISIEQLQGRKTGEGIPKDERRSAKAI